MCISLVINTLQYDARYTQLHISHYPILLKTLTEDFESFYTVSIMQVGIRYVYYTSTGPFHIHRLISYRWKYVHVEVVWQLRPSVRHWVNLTSSVSDIHTWPKVTVRLRTRIHHACKSWQYQTLLSTVVDYTRRLTSYVIRMQPTYSRWPRIGTGTIMWYRGHWFRNCIFSVVRTVGAKALMQLSLFHFIVLPVQCQACVTLRPPSLLVTSNETSE